jgi:GT2 family glycosyltransferase
MTERPTAPVAVVVVAWNADTWLTTCLESVAALRRPPAEIVVVDNASIDGSAARVEREFPQVDLVRAHRNLGFCAANNLGIGRTRSPFVLLLNPDTRLDPEFLEELLPAFADEGVGIACGKLKRFDGRTLDSCGQLLGRSRRPVDRGYGRPDHRQFDEDDEVFGACSAAAVYRRGMLDAIADPGGEVFDETFFAFFEDLDVAWRARRLGWRAVYRHRAVGFHARSASMQDRAWLRRRAALLGRSPEVRWHIVKNRWLTVLRNDSCVAYLRDLPFIWSRDVALLLVLGSRPSALFRLWRERRIFTDARSKRRIDRTRPRRSARIEVRDGEMSRGLRP